MAPPGAAVVGAVSDRERLEGGVPDGLVCPAWLVWGGDAELGAPVGGAALAGAEPAPGLGAAATPAGLRVSRETANNGRLVAAPRTPMGSRGDVRRRRTTAMWKKSGCGLAARSADLTGRPSVPDRPLGPV